MTNGMKTSVRLHSVLMAAGAAAGLLGIADGARAQWTVINMHPAGTLESDLRAVDGVTQVGVIDGNVTAALWRGSAESVVRLNPRYGGTSIAVAASGDLQGGTVAPQAMSGYAALWSGTAHSWVDLHPWHLPDALASGVHAMYGNMQGGSWVPRTTSAPVHFGRACIWSGTADSFVDLNPPWVEMSNVLGMAADHQVGVIWDTMTAAMWTGTAESYVDLNPPGAMISSATCTDGVHQYGVAAMLEPVPGLYPSRWSGTAESWESMGMPEGWNGEIGSAHSGWAAGRLYTPDGLGHAAAWMGEPGAYVDLHDLLPPEYMESYGNGIWRHTESGTAYVVGSALNGTTQRLEAMMWVTGPGVNLITGVGGPADCAASVGDLMVYTARVVNAGAEAAGAVTVTITLPPASVATFVGCTPAPSSVTPTEVTVDLGSLAATGGAAEVTLTLAAAGAGETAEVTFTASAAGEVHAENNTGSWASRITPVPAPSAVATAIFSTDPSLANSLVPGGGGARFNGFNRPQASPSGNWWTLRASTDQPDPARFVITRTPTGGTPQVIVQEGVTPTDNGTVVFARGLQVNDSGVVVAAGSDNGPQGGRRFVAKTTGAGLAVAAREGEPIPALPGEVYVDGPAAPSAVLADGSAVFLTGTWRGPNTAYVARDGAEVLAMAGQTPIGADVPIALLQGFLFQSGALGVDATGTQHIYVATLESWNPADDEAVVANGHLLVREGVTVLPGMEYPVQTVLGLTMGAGGTWMLRGRDTLGAHWAAVGQGQTFTRVIMEGEPIHAGSTEVWKAERNGQGFFLIAADSVGNYLIGGMTDRSDHYADAVLVYNGEAVVARENDPVDLDGNGVFDDGAYIRSFDPDSATFIPGAVLVTVELRGEDAALCHEPDVPMGQAVVRIPLPGGCAVDWDGSGSVNSADISAFLSSWLDSLNHGDLNADFDGSGSVNSADISAFLAAWLQGVQGNC